MFRTIFMVALALCLSATHLTAQGMLASATGTGVVGVTTSQVRLSNHPNHVLMGHVYVIERGGETVRALMIHQRHDGVHRLSFSEAYANNVALPFDAPSSATDGCMQDYCSDVYLGVIFFSEGLFERAQRVGLDARLVGPSGVMPIHAPAHVFATAAQMADRI